MVKKTRKTRKTRNIITPRNIRKICKGGGLGTSKMKPKSISPIFKKTKKVSFNKDPVSIVWKLSPQEKQEFYKRTFANNQGNSMTVAEKKAKKTKQKNERMTAIKKYNQTLKHLKELDEDIAIKNYMNSLQSNRKK